MLGIVLDRGDETALHRLTVPANVSARATGNHDTLNVVQAMATLLLTSLVMPLEVSKE